VKWKKNKARTANSQGFLCPAPPSILRANERKGITVIPPTVKAPKTEKPIDISAVWGLFGVCSGQIKTERA